jgi:hypothetical protein
VITTGEGGVGVFERVVWGWFGVGDKAAGVSVGTGIVHTSTLVTGHEARRVSLLRL